MVEMFGIGKTLEFLELRHNKDKTWSREELEQIRDYYKAEYTDTYENN